MPIVNKKILVLILAVFFAPPLSAQRNAKALMLKIASYNIQYNNKKDSVNTWEKRLPGVVAVFDNYKFDIVGAQEPYLSQMNDLMAKLPTYKFIGINIQGGTGVLNRHYTPIIYKAAKFDVLDWGTFWYSQTPNEASKGWDAFSLRICTWAKFKEKETGKEFYFFNSHFDHKGVIARKESASLLLAKIREIAGKELPIFVTGDFNTDQHHENYKVLAQSGIITDSYHAAKANENTETTTFNGYDPKRPGSKRIDHIFVTNNPKIHIDRYRIITDSFEGIYPSDHNPVLLDVIIK